MEDKYERMGRLHKRETLLYIFQEENSYAFKTIFNIIIKIYEKTTFKTNCYVLSMSFI